MLNSKHADRCCYQKYSWLKQKMWRLTYHIEISYFKAHISAPGVRVSHYKRWRNMIFINVATKYLTKEI